MKVFKKYQEQASISLLKFQLWFNWIFNDKTYSNFNISHNLNLISTKSFSLNPTNSLRVFKKYQEQFSMLKLFNIQQFLHCRSKHCKTICTPIHKRISNDTKCMARGFVIWKTSMWKSNITIYLLTCRFYNTIVTCYLNVDDNS